MAVSADYKISASGRKVHKMKKVADNNNDVKDDEDQKDVKESAVPDHMRGKQKPYVSSDGKGNFEVLGNKGQTKAEFSRKEHGSMAQGKARAHLKSKYDEYMKEEVELDEAADQQGSRFIQLARLGLVDKADVTKLSIAMDQLKADKPLSTQQRTLMLNVMMDLVNLVTGDDAVFQRVKMDVQKEEIEVEENYVSHAQRKAVWASRNDAKKEETDPPFDGPYTTTKADVTDKSGAKHNGMSRVRHLAQLALKKQQEKQANKNSNK